MRALRSASTTTTTALLLALGLLTGGCASDPAGSAGEATDAAPPASDLAPPEPDAAMDAESPPPSTGLQNAAVATYHRRATDAAVAVLEAGGNAFDAFIAATLVQYVLAPGVTSLAGPLSALIHTADGQVTHLDADFNLPLQPPASGADPRAAGILVPGAASGLLALHARHGSRPLAELAAPAIALADKGFLLDATYSAIIGQYADKLGATDYGKRTFFDPAGAPLPAGARLTQPELAGFVRALVDEGVDHVRTGGWAQRMVAVAGGAGSAITIEDLSRYRPAWVEPHRIDYRGHEIYAPAARQWGGLWVMLGLKVLENAELPVGLTEHFSRAADPLELLLRTARALHEELWFWDPLLLDDRAEVARKLEEAETKRIWSKVVARLSDEAIATVGHHSYHLSVVDHRGNAITGTHTITSMPWGDGLFVDGVPLTAGGKLGYPGRPGERWATPLSMHIVKRDGRLWAAVGTFGSGLLEAGLQLLVNLIDYRLDVDLALSLPRFGGFYADEQGAVDPASNYLDPAVAPQVVAALTARGLKLVQQDWVDTGLGTALVIEDGKASAAFAPQAYIGGAAATVPAKR